MRLTAASVTLELAGARILDGVDLSVGPGELVALVGPNGAGKSSLLAVLAGDLAPSSGSVELGTELGSAPVGEHAARDLARLRAVLPQQQTLSFGFRVDAVVRMGRTPWYRTSRDADDDRVVADALERTDMTALAERLFPTLSGGEQARTTFARVLAQETPVLLLDEPTAALDLRHQEALLELARGIAREGAAVVVVLHDLSLAAAYADRVCVLEGGRIRADGPPAEVLTGELLSEVYQHPVEVVRHGDALLVVPVRKAAGQPAASPRETAQRETAQKMAVQR